ncbi:MAG: serine hydrolase [Candidatus Bathyarchaeia archaeon]
MINVSDNSATNILIDLIGMNNVNDTLARLGLNKTMVLRKMMDREGLAAGRETSPLPERC